MVVVAHRLATVLNANILFVLREGKLLEKWTPSPRPNIKPLLRLPLYCAASPHFESKESAQDTRQRSNIFTVGQQLEAKFVHYRDTNVLKRSDERIKPSQSGSYLIEVVPRSRCQLEICQRYKTAASFSSSGTARPLVNNSGSRLVVVVFDDQWALQVGGRAVELLTLDQQLVCIGKDRGHAIGGVPAQDAAIAGAGNARRREDVVPTPLPDGLYETTQGSTTAASVATLSVVVVVDVIVVVVGTETSSVVVVAVEVVVLVASSVAVVITPPFISYVGEC